MILDTNALSATADNEAETAILMSSGATNGLNGE
jgi:hypothetical protein